MANPQHLSVLQDALAKKDIKIWNTWYAEQPDADESFGADLTNANLALADLTFARLTAADLTGANLKGARLFLAQLSANLTNANLTNAYLFRADLSRANLSRAHLSRADLTLAYLTHADLTNAHLTHAVFGGNEILDVDLSTVQGLETVLHKFPSEISISTLYKSKGLIPEVFLRGCGVPDTMIAFAKSLVNSAIKYYSCFISYSSHDEHFARRLYNDLQANGVRVWFAPHDLKTGDPFRDKIDEAVRLYDKLIVVLSKNSIKSDWVQTEIETGYEKERQLKKHRGKDSPVLFPLRLDDSIMRTKMAWAANIRRTRHIADFTKWENPIVYQGVMNKLLSDLNAKS